MATREILKNMAGAVYRVTPEGAAVYEALMRPIRTKGGTVLVTFPK